MLTDPKLRSSIDQLWDKLWTGGLSNPLDAIEQLSYLIFLKRLDDQENQRQRLASMRGQIYYPKLPDDMRWGYWTNLTAEEALKHARGKVFPWLKTLGGNGEVASSFTRYMEGAEFKISKASNLVSACNLLNDINISAQNQDVQGDIYEYLLSRLTTSGLNGQFRTPRHIIRMMVDMLDPKKNERVGDLAAGTCGFLVNAYQHILEKNTDPSSLSYDEAGEPHGASGDLLSETERTFLQNGALRGFDSDSGMTMLRIGSMNLLLHGLENPQFFWADSLSKDFEEKNSFDVLLMNPPFKGAVDKGDVSESLPSTTKKSELLFLHLMLRVLDSGGRAAVIVPDGVLFGSSRAHVDIRKKLVEENRLDGVVSMPSGVFKPYAGVSTAILFFTKGAKTESVWYYDMAHDGLSLDDKRTPTSENDIPDLVRCWHERKNKTFWQNRQERIETLKKQLEPLKARRLGLLAEVNRLTFESVIAPEDDTSANEALKNVKEKLSTLENQIAPLQPEYDRLKRYFWVDKADIVKNKYDLSASRYKDAEQDDAYFEKPEVTLERLMNLEKIITSEANQLMESLR
jgi:type I restriction enzyme M protein